MPWFPVILNQSHESYRLVSLSIHQSSPQPTASYLDTFSWSEMDGYTCGSFTYIMYLPSMSTNLLLWKYSINVYVFCVRSLLIVFIFTTSQRALNQTYTHHQSSLQYNNEDNSVRVHRQLFILLWYICCASVHSLPTCISHKCPQLEYCGHAY